MAAKPEALPAAHTVAVTGQADDRAVRTRFLLGEIFVAANGISRFNRSFVQAFPRARNKLLEPDDKHAEPAELYRLQQIFECRYFTTLEQASLRLQGAALALDSIVRMVISKESASVYGGSEHPHFRVLQRTIFLFSWILTDLHEKVKQSKDYKTVADCSKSQPAVKDALDILNRIEAYLAPVSGLAVSVKVPIAAYVSVNTWLRLTQLQLAWPDHPIFATVAAPESKIPSCQYFTKSQSSCWYKRSFEYGRTIERNYLDLRPDTRFFSPGDCWWRKRKESAIAKTQGLARPVDTKFRMHRLLAFLAVRTWESWELWLDTKKWFTLHDCHNGFVGEANHPAGCANGLFHLHFGTDRENRLQKRCKLRDRSQCPGHGANRVKCIYVHIGSGTLKPCLNGDAQNPPPAGCLCKTPCFVRRVEDSPGSWQYLMTAD
ncbi:hypothetical protein FKW77_006875 [Venturia effusa]|uniref:Uncharacterized protein n=1 Tax=Venturia effusa TaxID=50376 RepID=A0A517L9I6_9PEZI|nr:hypothetical protein FKW77_006875 [Venturia effusa]